SHSINALTCEEDVIQMSGGLHCLQLRIERQWACFHPEMNSLSKKGKRVLTAREREILRLIVKGKSNRQIAAELKLSANTVRVHRANIMTAVGIHKSTRLVAYAMQTGLVATARNAEPE